MASRAEEYRRYARQCLKIAATFQDKEAQATLLGFAQAWSRLAHLAQANRYIAELTVQCFRQRVIVKHALDTGQRSERAEALLDALEGSLRIFEKYRIFLLSRDGTTIFRHACKLGLEGIVSKRKDSPYRSGRSPDWLKMKNSDAPAVKREAEEDWAR